MKLNLLLVSIDKFPSEVDLKIQEHGFSRNYARGRLKTKEILDQEEINGVLWHYKGYSEALAMDLIGTFSQHDSVPVVIFISDIEEPEHLKALRNRVMIVDINDNIKETLIGIEDICLSRKSAQKTTATGPELHEIDFKQVMKPIVTGQKRQFKQTKKSSFNLLTPWSAVDSQEKNVISKPYRPPTKNLIQRLVEKLKRILP